MAESERSRSSAESPAESGSPDRARFPVWVRRPLRWVRKAGIRSLQALLIAWSALAIYYSNLPWPAARLALAIAFGAFAIYALWIARRSMLRWVFTGAFLAVVVWYVLIPPLNDRPWRTEVERPARATINGDLVQFVNYRNFRHHGLDAFDVRYEERQVDVSRLVSLDLFISYWNVGPVAHTFLSFNFDDGSPPVCISIETRPELGEGFNPLASLFKQFELVYVVGDERDLVRVRTDYRNEEVFLYRLNATPESARALFRVYLDRINSLADRPEWYHLLKNNCTLNVIRYSRRVGGSHARFDLRHYFNGLIDAYLFQLGMIDTSLEFDELRRVSHINDVARATGDAEDFAVQIRKGLPGMPLKD